ncbi:MAG: hypothetical protein ACT4P1_10915 [Sporichthyaceae bacterium]
MAGFVWLELAASNRGSTGTITTFFSLYIGANLLGALAFGQSWFARCDGFEVFSTLIGRLAMIGRRTDGVLIWRNPLDNLDSVREAPGLVAVLAVMLGSTAFDSVTSTTWWLEISFDSELSPQDLNTVGLAATIATVGAAFTVIAWSSGLLAHRQVPGSATAFAHSLVPIAVGYLIAHYFSLLVFAGQQTLIYASDPMVDGSNLFGTGNWGVNYSLVSVTAIALVQMLAIVAGHVLGVLAAHDRSVRLFRPDVAVVSQLPMMALMIAYTLGGLSLLFAE